MKITVIGTGYVGLVSGTCFAEMGHSVTCIDIDQNKVKLLEEGKSPIYEPGLNELLKRNIDARRLKFSCSYDSIEQSRVVFLAVGTPSDEEGKADMKYMMAALDDLARVINEEIIVVVKSTVPIGSHKEIRDRLKKSTGMNISIVSNPEFLKEGNAISDFMKPDRVVIGSDREESFNVMEELYAPLVRQGNPIYRMSNISAELTKYAANCFLATKISFINEMANLCDKIGADIDEVRQGMTSDQRIGQHFFYPGPGYGGSCFPKDVKALMGTAREVGHPLHIVEATDEVNKTQKTILYKKMKDHFKGDLDGKVFSFWGVSFKPNTDDVRESAAIDMAKEITAAGGTIHYHDPVASENFKSTMSEHAIEMQEFQDMYECLRGTDGLIVLTDWSEFKTPDLSLIKSLLKTPVVFDGRNLFNTQKVWDAGLDYYAIGKRTTS